MTIDLIPMGLLDSPQKLAQLRDEADQRLAALTGRGGGARSFADGGHGRAAGALLAALRKTQGGNLARQLGIGERELYDGVFALGTLAESAAAGTAQFSDGADTGGMTPARRRQVLGMSAVGRQILKEESERELAAVEESTKKYAAERNKHIRPDRHPAA